MFPNYVEFDEPKRTARGKSFLFDFEKGDFATVDGRLIIVDKIDALKVWIEKILKTEKFKFKVYDNGEKDQYGTTLLEFVNSDYPLDFMQSEIEREVRNALLKNNEIIGLNSFKFHRDKRTLICEFVANTIYGEVKSVVMI